MAPCDGDSLHLALFVRVVQGLMELRLSVVMPCGFFGQVLVGKHIVGGQTVVRDCEGQGPAILIIGEIGLQGTGDLAAGIDSLADNMGGLGYHALLDLGMAHANGHDRDND